MTQFADLNAIYNALGRIEATVVAVKETQDRDNKRQDQNAADLERRVDRHDDQLNSINQKIHWGTGLLTAFGLVAGWLGKSQFGGGGNPL